MAEGYLVAAFSRAMSKSALRRYQEHRKQGGLAPVGRRVKGGLPLHILDAECRTMFAQGRRVAVVGDVAHAYVDGCEG